MATSGPNSEQIIPPVEETFEGIGGHFINLLRTFDTFLDQLLKRLRKPDNGLFGPSGVPDQACLSTLGPLVKALELRFKILGQNDGFNDFYSYVYDKDIETLKTVTDTIKGIWGLLKDPVNNKTFKISLNDYKINIVHYNKSIRIRFLVCALEALKVLNSRPCNERTRIQHFSSNIIDKKEKVLGLEEWEIKAQLWIDARKKSIKIAKSTAETNNTVEESLIAVMPNLSAAVGGVGGGGGGPAQGAGGMYGGYRRKTRRSGRKVCRTVRRKTNKTKSHKNNKSRRHQ